MGTARTYKELTAEEIARAESSGLKTDGMTREQLLAQATACYKDLAFADPSRLAELVLGLVTGANLNGVRITRDKKGETLFIPLPRVLWQPTGNVCRCPVCLERGDADGNPAPSFWDTLAIAIKPDPKRSDTAWTVHHPALHRVQS